MDTKRIKEQISEMQDSRETKVSITENIRTQMLENRQPYVRELAKFQLLLEVFQGAERALLHRQESLKQQNPPLDPIILEGVDAAVIEMNKVLKQVQDMLLRQEGAMSAFTSMDEILKKNIENTLAQTRGLGLKMERIEKPKKNLEPKEMDSKPVAESAPFPFED